MIKILLLLFPVLLFAQTKKIIYTSVDYANNDVRAAICNINGTDKYELGFNKTYLPVWFGNKIIYNSDTFLWMCDTTGKSLKQLNQGYRVSVSHNSKMLAYYSASGIDVLDSSLNIIKKIEVSPWEVITITWTKDNSKVSFYDLNKEKCYLFDIKHDSLITFGDSVYHPLWNPINDKILYNKKTAEGKYDVFVIDSLGDKKPKKVNKPGEMAVVPIWSKLGDKIAYLVINENPPKKIDSDMLPASLVLYDAENDKRTVLAEDVGFTDQAFPQIDFDENDSYIYFTVINMYGIGSLTRINLKP